MDRVQGFSARWLLGVSHAARMAHYAVKKNISLPPRLRMTKITVEQVKQHLEKKTSDDNAFPIWLLLKLLLSLIRWMTIIAIWYGTNLLLVVRTFGMKNLQKNQIRLQKINNGGNVIYRCERCWSRNVEDQIHKPVLTHLDRVVSKAVLKADQVKRESKEVEEAEKVKNN